MVPLNAIGLKGFTKVGFATTVKMEVLPYVEITTPMYNRIVSGSTDHFPSIGCNADVLSLSNN